MLEELISEIYNRSTYVTRVSLSLTNKRYRSLLYTKLLKKHAEILDGCFPKIFKLIDYYYLGGSGILESIQSMLSPKRHHTWGEYLSIQRNVYYGASRYGHFHVIKWLESNDKDFYRSYPTTGPYYAAKGDQYHLLDYFKTFLEMECLWRLAFKKLDVRLAIYLRDIPIPEITVSKFDSKFYSSLKDFSKLIISPSAGLPDILQLLNYGIKYSTDVTYDIFYSHNEGMVDWENKYHREFVDYQIEKVLTYDSFELIYRMKRFVKHIYPNVTKEKKDKIKY